MATSSSTSSTALHLLTTHRSLIDTTASFLTVLTHHILYLRHIYPPVSFLSTRAYNYPVRQNRHPAVCTWINDAISAVRDQLTKNTVSNVAVCIYELDSNRVLERWVIDLHSLPSILKRDRDVPFDYSSADEQLPHKINLVDLEATFRATLSRLTTASSRLKPLPSGPSAPELSFTLTISLHEGADKPVGRLDKEERKWIVAEPDSFSTNPTSSSESATKQNNNNSDASNPQPTKTLSKDALHKRDGRTTPLNRLSLPPPIPLHMELWVEESAYKFSFATPNERTPAVRAAEMSYGAGSEKFFDPNHGYEDIEGTDVNRKPGGGIGMDYRSERM